SPAAILHEPPGRTGRPRPFRKPVWFFECAAPTDSLQATRDWTRDEARDEWIDVLGKGRRILHQKRDRLLLLHGLASDVSGARLRKIDAHIRDWLDRLGRECVHRFSE